MDFVKTRDRGMFTSTSHPGVSAQVYTSTLGGPKYVNVVVFYRREMTISQEAFTFEDNSIRVAAQSYLIDNFTNTTKREEILNSWRVMNVI